MARADAAGRGERREAGPEAAAPLVRPGTDADGPGIAAVMRAIFAGYPHCFFVPEEVPELAAVASHYRGRGGEIWVATLPAADGAERVVGSLACTPTADPSTFEIFKVYLLPEVRGRGLAADMMARAVARARAAGARRLRLWSDDKFVEGHAFYRRQGFRRLAAIRFLNDVSLTWEYGFEKPLEPPAHGGAP